MTIQSQHRPAQDIKFWADNTLTVTATKSASGDNEVVAAQTGKKLVLQSVSLQRAAASTAETTCILKSGSTAFATIVLNEYVPAAVVFDAINELQFRRLGASEAFNLNLSAANGVIVNCRYSVLE